MCVKEKVMLKISVYLQTLLAVETHIAGGVNIYVVVDVIVGVV